ncbi:MAG: hypothetical protein D5S00_04380 [Tindallia sp. MSAO_Bac2]|nr:MAG: hypothetical protein D5S00_04380 [Tindallia sp. MSAO_Bac2]
MKNRDYTPGFILIGLGILFLLRNFGFISFRYLFQFWPVMLIIAGINLIFEKYPYVSVITWTLFFVIIITLGIMIEHGTYMPMIPFPF